MADILDAVAQQEVADSILNAPVVGSWKDGALSESESQPSENDKALADLSTDRTEAGERQEQVDRLIESEWRPPGEGPNQQATEAPQQLTPEAVREGVAGLENFIQEHNLNDPASAKEFADGFSQAFGGDMYAFGVNVEALGSTMAKTVLSAANVYGASQGDPSRVAPVPPEAARAFAYDFVKSFGVDPRNVPMDHELLANTVFQAAFNFIDTVQRYGSKVSDLSVLNNPDVADYFAGQFMRAFGVEQPLPREVTLKLADAFGKYILGFLPRLGQIEAKAAPAKNRTSSQGRSKRFRTNQDIFSPEVLERLELEKSRGNGADFAPRPRRDSAWAGMRSNRDLFDDATLGYYELQHGRL